MKHYLTDRYNILTLVERGYKKQTVIFGCSTLVVSGDLRYKSAVYMVHGLGGGEEEQTVLVCTVLRYTCTPPSDV